jgi:hypothetical protein
MCIFVPGGHFIAAIEVFGSRVTGIVAMFEDAK